MSKKIKIVADDKIPFLKGVLEPFADVFYFPGKEITNEKVLDAEAIIVRTRTKCNKELLKNSIVKLITTATIGYDHIDLDYCKKNNIEWINAPGCNSTSVMQYITTILLKIAQKDNFQLVNKTIGVVGVGNVGSKIQKVSEILGMRVLLNDPPREKIEGSDNFVSLDNIIEESDIISFHVPLEKEGLYKTFHLADDTFFDKLSRKPLIINSSRGEVIDTAALKKAVRNNKLSRVVLDVWESEPEIDLELQQLVEYGTPHIAGYSGDGKANGTSVCVNKISKFFNFDIEKNWYPQNIPSAKSGNKIYIECTNKNEQQVLEEVVSSTYSIEYDHEKLKNHPGSFEEQRGNYPTRREFSNYYVKLEGCSQNISGKLIEMGFNIITN